MIQLLLALLLLLTVGLAAAEQQVFRSLDELASQVTVQLLNSSIDRGEDDTEHDDTLQFPFHNECLRDLNSMFNFSYVNADQSKKMISYSSVDPGNIGNYQLCQQLPEAYLCTYSTDTTVVLAIGLCVPISCNSDNLLTAFNLSYQLDQIGSYHCGDNKATSSLGVQVTLACFGTFLAVLILFLLPYATYLDMYPKHSVRQQEDSVMRLQRLTGDPDSDIYEAPLLVPGVRGSGDNFEPTFDDVDNKQRSSGFDSSDFYAPERDAASIISSGGVQQVEVIHSNGKANREYDVPSPMLGHPGHAKESTVMQLIMAFSLKRNFKSLFFRAPTRKYRALDGMRALSMYWVILGHTIDFASFKGFSNPEAVYGNRGVMGSVWFQFVLSAQFAVDTFFFLSGFLSSHVLYKKLRSSNKPLNKIGIIVHRFLRLLPILMFVLFFTMVITRYMGSGPLWFHYMDFLKPCDKYWWSNLLFINNFYPVSFDNQCLPWTWYLANDFQFFIVGLFIIHLFHDNKKAATALVVLLLVASIVANMIITGTNNLTPVSPSSQDLIYDKPYTRSAPYLAGILVCFLFNTVKPTTKSLWKRTAIMLSSIFILGISCTLLRSELQYHDWSSTLTMFYNGFVHIMWSAGLTGIIYLCLIDEGGAVDWFLSFAMWDWMGKLTYCAYLVHPIIMRLYYFGDIETFTFTPTSFFLTYFGFVTLSYLIAIALYVTVEAPFGVATNLLLRGPPKKSSKGLPQ